MVCVRGGFCSDGVEMNLYLIQQSENGGYDTYDSAVVAAPDEETARNIDPSGDGEPMKWGKSFSSWCFNPSQVHVILIGTTELAQGVVCASFNAG